MKRERVIGDDWRGCREDIKAGVKRGGFDYWSSSGSAADNQAVHPTYPTSGTLMNSLLSTPTPPFLLSISSL